MGFAIPVKKWVLGILTPKIDYYLGTKFIEKQDIFNAGEVLKLVKTVRAENGKGYERIWYFLMFQMWYEKWMM